MRNDAWTKTLLSLFTGRVWMMCWLRTGKPHVTLRFDPTGPKDMYERALFTGKYMPPAELDSPLWLSGLSPSDVADPSAARQVRLTCPPPQNLGAA